MATVATSTFADRLGEAVERKRSQLVVGLDPRLDLLPVELRGEAVLGRAEAANAYARFCCGIVDAVGRYVVAVKPQTAFFEALGADGFAALERVCGYARAAGLLVIADGKRGDIGSTARAYAAAYLEPRGEEPALADALTVNTYLGGDSVEPFLQACRLHGAGIFCLVRTSNCGRRRCAGADALRRPPGVAARRRARRASGARISSASAASRASARSSARPSRARSPRRGSSCPSPSCCCRASARRARPRPMSRGPSRAGRRARS